MLALLLAGCGARDYQSQAEAPYDAPAPSMELERGGGVADDIFYGETPGIVIAPGQLPTDNGPERMIIRNGSLELVVRDTLATQEEIGLLVDRLDGYIVSSESYRYSTGLFRITLTLRVPAEQFNAAMTELRGMATEVTRDSVSSEDVTQEYVDLESRLRALEAKAERLEALMDQAEDTEAVLAVYRELSSTNAEIEQVKGRMRYLERSATMSTITVQLTPDQLAQPIEVGGWRPQGIAKNAIEALIGTLQFFAGALIWIVIFILPIVVILGLLIFGMIKLLQLIFGRRKSKKGPQAPPTE